MITQTMTSTHKQWRRPPEIQQLYTFIYLDSYDLTGTGTSLIGGILGRSVPSGEHM